ncbi:hypothetical protein J0X15_18360 [Roseibium sp. CAU 1637]|uniref:von Hippel-Lindau disease tumour suppressor beta domain-containing protein n=1 Tax=Roseibium limicola TaxID=2816037 RepID=A0A939JB87_9HYPH|nr:hypothetical protein [Roseibium limicola]MBO0347198.1 hypothetical protein [Roseibium limicola]
MRPRNNRASRLLFSAAASAVLLLATAAQAQTPPETLRIQVKPVKPGIRSVTIDGRYRPIISRDDAGVVIDTLGSADSLPPCSVELQVTLENSRVLNRSADLCSGDTLLVDVGSDGKPAGARVIGGSEGAVPSPTKQATPAAETRKSDPSSTPAQSATRPQPPRDQDPATADESGPAMGQAPATRDQLTEKKTKGDGGTLLKPLEKVDTPIDNTPESAKSSQDLNTIVGESLNRHRPKQDGSTKSPASGDAVTVGQAENRVWESDPGSQPGDRSYLTHGVSQTDDIDFRAACLTQSGQATIVFAQTSPSTSEGVTEPVSLSAGAFSMTYTAVGSSSNNQYGQSFPQVTLPLTDPLWQSLISESQLKVQIQGTPAYSVSLKGSATPVRLFVATCSEPQRIVGEDPANGFGTEPSGFPGQPGGSGPGRTAADLSCSEAGRVRSLQGERNGQIVFQNNSTRPVDVNWIGYDGNTRHFATLEPGQMLNQPTFVTHAWLVRETNGPCLGIFVSRSPYREVSITGGQRFEQPQTQPFNQNNNGFGAPPPAPGFDGGPAGPLPPADIGGPRPLGSSSGFGNGNSNAGFANVRVADYLCDAGVDLRVTFSPDQSQVTIAQMGAQQVTLPRLGAASSFAYGREGFLFQGQPGNTTWSRPGQRDVFCSLR